MERYACPGPVLKSTPAKNTQLIVVIPCYFEPDIIDSLQSLYRCQLLQCQVEVIVVVNHSAADSQHVKDFNHRSLEEIKLWAAAHQKNGLAWEVIEAFDLPARQAGVGLARKIGMDEALRRFEAVGSRNGIIACFDADCTCTTNYLMEIHSFYMEHPKAVCAILHFEHPLKGALDAELYQHIADYELHLRYYKNALALVGFPYAFHTVGSCITVTSVAYQKQGGMNKRKAGEDFYFLQKISQLGKVHTIANARVYPSPRPSDRVPFGTGRAISTMLNGPSMRYSTYHPQTFIEFGALMKMIPQMFESGNVSAQIGLLPMGVSAFLKEIDFEQQLSKIKKNSTTEVQFLKGFFNWFNGFLALKYVHFSRDHGYADVEIHEAIYWLLKEMKLAKEPGIDKKEALELLRQWDKSH